MLINTTQVKDELLLVSDIRWDIYRRLRWSTSNLIEWLSAFIYRILRRRLVYVAEDLWQDLLDVFGRSYGDLISQINNQIRREWSKHYVTTNTTSPR